MSVNEPINDFLAQPENLSIALEVADYIDRLKRRLHKRFWTDFNPRMKLTVKDSIYSTSWTYRPHPAKNYRSNWAKSYISPRATAESNPHMLQLAFGQGPSSSDYRLYWGVRWTKPPEDFDSSELTKLAGLLLARGISIVESPRWVSWGWYKYVPYEMEFLHRMQTEHEAFVDEIAGDVWQLFEEVRPSLEAINQQLAGQ